MAFEIKCPCHFCTRVVDPNSRVYVPRHDHSWSESGNRSIANNLHFRGNELELLEASGRQLRMCWTCKHVEVINE